MNRAPLVLDVRDLWPAAAVSLNQIEKGAQLQLAEWLEAELYRQAAVVTAVTGPFCEHIDAIRSGGPRSVLLPNGTLDMFFENGDPERLAAPDEFLVTFAGTHGIAQALASVLDAAERIGAVPGSPSSETGPSSICWSQKRGAGGSPTSTSTRSVHQRKCRGFSAAATRFSFPCLRTRPSPTSYRRR